MYFSSNLPSHRPWADDFSKNILVLSVKGRCNVFFFNFKSETLPISMWIRGRLPVSTFMRCVSPLFHLVFFYPKKKWPKKNFWCRMFGLKEHQIVLHGLPIRPGFSTCKTSKPVLRRRLGISPTLPAVLMVGGGEGMGKLEQTVSAIAERSVPCQVKILDFSGIFSICSPEN